MIVEERIFVKCTNPEKFIQIGNRAYNTENHRVYSISINEKENSICYTECKLRDKNNIPGYYFKKRDYQEIIYFPRINSGDSWFISLDNLDTISHKIDQYNKLIECERKLKSLSSEINTLRHNLS